MNKVLVTGATGFLGRCIVHKLIKQDFAVRALVRKSSSILELDQRGIELVYGDVTDPDSLLSAFADIDYVIHAAAGTSGSEEQMRQVTIDGTRNILKMCRRFSPCRMVYISSCSVYGTAGYIDGTVLDESAPLETHPHLRGAYSLTKLEAERLVTDAINRGDVDATCIRPGTIYGPGGENYTPILGFSFKNKVFVVIDRRSFFLPLVYVDNLADAIVLAMMSNKSNGKIYNVVDTEQVDKKRYMDTLIRKLLPGTICLYFPYRIFGAIVAVQEQVFGLLKREPMLSMYRLESSQNPVVYDVSKIQDDLGWCPAVGFVDAVEELVCSNAKKTV